jgi:hypothetical protein
VHCRNCGRQERCARNCCQCRVLWHHCHIHRVDPEKHVSRKPPIKTAEAKTLEREKLQEAIKKKGAKKVRKAPIIDDSRSEVPRSKASNKRKEEGFYRQQGYQRPELNATLQPMQMRIRAKRKTEITEETKRTIEEDTNPRDVQRRLRGKQKRPTPLETMESRKRKLEEDQAIESETEKKRTKRGDDISNGATSSQNGSHSRVVMEK